jgi:hypothetical protein
VRNCPVRLRPQSPRHEHTERLKVEIGSTVLHEIERQKATILHAIEFEVSFASRFPRTRRTDRWERNLQKSPGFTMTSLQTARGITAFGSKTSESDSRSVDLKKKTLEPKSSVQGLQSIRNQSVYWPPEFNSPPLIVFKPCHTLKSIVSARNRTVPSAINACAPPVCTLLAPGQLLLIPKQVK